MIESRITDRNVRAATGAVLWQCLACSCRDRRTRSVWLSPMIATCVGGRSRRVAGHAPGRGQRRSASKTSRSSGASASRDARASRTAASAIAAFQPRPTSACLPCARRIAASSLLGASTRVSVGSIEAASESAPTWGRSSGTEPAVLDEPTWVSAWVIALDSAGRWTSSRSAVPAIASAPRWWAR